MIDERLKIEMALQSATDLLGIVEELLGTRMLAVAYRNLVGPPIGSADDANKASREEFAQIDRSSRRRMQRCATESLLGDLLELMASHPSSHWQLTRNRYGKPTLVTPDARSAIEVSLSHSGPLALAAITDLGEIGVDLEYRAPGRSICQIAAYAFGPQEQRVVESGGLRDFYRIWTLREALSKSCGIGFPMLADGRDYFPEAPDSGNWQSVIDGCEWLFSTGDLGGDYAVSVALALRSPIRADCRTDLTPRQFG
jgi:4'-phosphopantetheinyl transferase